MKKIKEYMSGVGKGQWTLFQIPEYRFVVLIICSLNLLHTITNQKEIVFVITLISLLVLYLSISLKYILKVFKNEEINDIMNSVIFIEYLTLTAYFGVTYITWLIS